MNQFYYSSHLDPSWEAILYSLGRRRTTTLSAWGWRRGKGPTSIYTELARGILTRHRRVGTETRTQGTAYTLAGVGAWGCAEEFFL